MPEAGIDPRVLDILRRRPRLQAAVLDLYDMIEGRRNCRVSVDVVNNAIRLFRESQERSVPLDIPDTLDIAGNAKPG